jgi:putative ABC transport system permease protein
MFKNYFKTAIRNLLRYKGFAIINISSLTIGIIGCLVIGLFVWDEWQYDKNIKDGRYIFRIYEENGNNTVNAPVAPAYATHLKQHYPEVDETARMLMSVNSLLMEADEKRSYEDKGWFVDSSFCKLFSLKFISGDPITALSYPRSVVLSEELAKKYFGKNNSIDKTIRIDKDTFVVKGVLAKLPDHFHLDFRYLMTLSASGISKERMEKWTWHQFYTYVKLKPGANPQQLQNKLRAYMKSDIEPGMKQTGSLWWPSFQPLNKIHLYSSDFVYDNAIRGNITYVKALTIVALFILVIACFNFINLATARSFRRAKEIGVRKVVGAERKQLVLQFMSETILLSLLSVLIASLAIFLIVPLLNNFTGKLIQFNLFTNPALAGLILSGGIIVGLLAGFYPALLLSGFQPIKVLKNLRLSVSGTPWLRHALVVIQFSLSVSLIVSALIVYKQTNYLNNTDLGFSKEQVVYFPLRDSLATNSKTLETFKNELRQSSNVVSLTSGYGLPGDLFAGDGVIVGKEKKEQGASVFVGDYDYVKTLGLRIIAGRDFSRDISTDVREAFIINETAVKEWDLGTPEKAIGVPISWNEWVPQDTLNPVKKGKVIGVVEDFHYKSLHEKVAASAIQLYPQVKYAVAVKLSAANIKNSIAYINNVWNKFVPGYPLEYKFMDESYSAMYKSEEKLASLLWIFTIMAIIVGCMGLFGLAAFSAEQRTKELGIRKVLGANAFDIVGLLSKNFLVLVMIASLIAFPIAWWAMNSWLKDFPYRINISWWIFVIAIIAALAVALLTVSFQAIKAAIANPVKSLRTE